jgi:hypothetical protein
MLDVLIRGATVYLGDALPFARNVGVERGQIALVSRRDMHAPAVKAREVVDWCLEPGAQLDANSRRPSAMQVSVSVGRASFENGVCQTW